MSGPKKLLFNLFGFMSRSLRGLGLRRVPGAGWLFDRLYGALRPRGPVQVDHRGFKMWIDPRDDGVATQILVNGTYEPGVTNLLENLLEPGMTLLDVGANFGYFTMIASRCVGCDGRVLAIEPEPHNLDLLMRNVQLNALGNVTVDARALSRSEGTTPLHLDSRNLAAHSLSAGNVFQGSESIEVKTTALDSIFHQLGRIDVIKMDVQGAEGLVIEGGERSLSVWDGKMVMELWPHGLRSLGTDPLALLQRLIGWGHRVHLIDDAGGETTVVSPEEAVRAAEAEQSGRGHVNLLMTRAVSE